MNPLDDYLEMKKEAGLMDLARGAWRGFTGGTDPSRALSEAKDVASRAGKVIEKFRGKGLPPEDLVDAYSLAESAAKAPVGFDALSRGFSLGQKAQTPLAIGAAALATTGMLLAIKKIHGAMTKQRDFKSMMNLNPELQEAQAQRPQMFNAAYSSLRKLNPTFGADPMVSGAYMKKMMILNPEQAGMILAEAAAAKTPSPSVGFGGMKLGPISFK